MCALFQEHRRKVSAQLFDAIRRKDVKLAKKYVEDGAEVDFQDKWGDTALHQCAVYNQADIAKELVFHRADPNAQNTMGMTPLMVAVRCKRSNMVNALLRAGADLDARTVDVIIEFLPKLENVLKERLRKQDLRKQLLYDIKTATELLDGTTLSVAERLQTSQRLDDLKLELENLH